MSGFGSKKNLIKFKIVLDITKKDKYNRGYYERTY